MSSSQPLEIRVIYSASKRPASPKRRGAARSASSETAAQRSAPAIGRTTRSIAVSGTSTRPWFIIALLNLLVAGGLYYGIWWKADKFIGFKLIMNTPIVGMDADVVANQLFPGGAPDPNSDINIKPVSEKDQPRFTGATGRNLIIGSAYGWETISTIAVCLLAFGAGTSVGRGTQSRLRRVGVILALGGLLWMAYLTYDIWSRYDVGFKTNHFRMAMGVLAAWFLLLGIAVDRGHRKWLRIGAWSLIVSGVATGVALYLGNQCGAIDDEWVTPYMLLRASVGHSLYGWILLPVSGKLTAR